MLIRPYTVRPGTVAGGSILLHPTVRPYTVRPRVVGAPDWDAQTFYFRSTTPAEVSPSFDGAWTVTTGAQRRHLATAPLAADTIAAGTARTWTAGQLRLDRQYVGPMMRGGVALTAALFNGVILCSETDADDNVLSRIGLRVFDASGTIERAVLLAVDAYGTQVEYSTFSHVRTVADDEEIGTYVTLPGDRIVAEIGSTDAAGTTPGCTHFYGSSAAVDFSKMDGNPGAQGNGWLRITPAAA